MTIKIFVKVWLQKENWQLRLAIEMNNKFWHIFKVENNIFPFQSKKSFLNVFIGGSIEKIMEYWVKITDKIYINNKISTQWVDR